MNSNAPFSVKTTPYVRVSESRLRDAKEIFEKDAREKGLRIIVDKEK